MTGRDPIDCQPVRLDDALLYLADWQIERTLLMQEKANKMPAFTIDLPTYIPRPLAAVESFWRKQPCSACDAPGTDCPDRAAALADFVALTRAVGVSSSDAREDHV